MQMPTMTDLTETQQRILAALEEFRFNNIYALLNTICEPLGTSDEIEAFQAAVSGLVSQKLIVVGTEGFVPRNESLLDEADGLRLIATLEHWYRFDEIRKIWTLSKGEIRLSRIPILRLTSLGLEMSRSVLAANGYQWWRSIR
jgi:hypothetical protein